MKKINQEATKSLADQHFITKEQASQINKYRNLDFFSLHNELKTLLYISVLLFTSGMGILIYQNIDTIGHIAILSLLLIVIIISFYFCFKNSDGFKKEATVFKNSIFDYLVLAANILSCIFIGYLQFQYKTFGLYYGLATLASTLVSFFCAYYFDNKSCLSIAITGLTAYIGLTVNPKALLNNEIYENPELSISAIILGVLLILWVYYSDKIQLKKHFNFVFFTFALHLIAIACIANSFENNWWLFEILLGIIGYYFYQKSYEYKAMSLYFFTIIYAYIGLNIMLYRFLDFTHFYLFTEFVVILAPVYSIASIIAFIFLIKKFNKKEIQ